MEQHQRVSRVRRRLIEAARSGQLVHYAEFINDPYYRVARGQSMPHKIGNVLGEICEEEKSAVPPRPLLSAICVLNDASQMPSRGFWGFLDLSDDAPELEKRQRWESERDAVFEYWQNH